MDSPITRRALLKTLGVAGSWAALPHEAWAQTAGRMASSSSAKAIIAYLETLRRDKGGYGFADQERAHLTPTFAVIGCYRLLQVPVPRAAEVAAYVRANHPRELKKLEQERRVFEFQQVQALAWLGEDVSAFRTTIGAWNEPLPYLKQYEQQGYPVFQSELGAVLARPLLGLPVTDLAAYKTYLAMRRRMNGSFNNTPAADGGDGHVMNTWWGLQALRILGGHEERRAEAIAWLQGCQRENGGFTFQPQPEFGGVDDVAYTRAAVRSLQLLGAKPRDAQRCVSYIRSLVTADGGFSDRAGWQSNPLATYYALDALDALSELSALDSAGARDGAGARDALVVQEKAIRTPLPENLRVFTIQIQAHGQGSPQDAVELAGSLKIDLWGAKNAKPEWLAQARVVAAARGVPVTFVVANEEYGTWVNVPGLGTYSHTSDLVAPAGADIGPALAQRGNTRAVSWPEFRTRRLAPLERGGGRLVWQFGENEELVRMLLDDSVERGGFAAISTFHFGNPDFTNTEPFLQRWRGKIPFIALQDAHGPEPWWFSDMTTGFRTVFLGTEPTWEAWLRALREDWVVPIRHDQWTGGKTWMHSGSKAVLDYVKARESSWRWWDNPAIARPMVSLAVVKPEDEFEAGRPDRGVVLRVRSAWENTPQGLARKPISEFVSLTVDGRRREPSLVERKRPNGLFEEHAHHLALPDIAAGQHRATVVVRERATRREFTSAVEFSR